MNTHDIELPQGYAERPFDYSGDLYTEGQMRAAVEADRKRRGVNSTHTLGEPVGYIMPTALKQLKAGGHAVVGGVSQGFDVPIYTAPQPDAPVKVNAIFETQDDEVIGTTDAKVKRVEWQDDGSLTVVIDHWPHLGEPGRGPFTAEKIEILWKETLARMGCGGDPVLWFARAIERAHGIPTPQPAESCASLISDKTACGSDKGNCDPQPAEPVHETTRTVGNGAESGMNTGSQGGAHMVSQYSICCCNSGGCRVNGCLSLRQAQSVMAPGGGGMPAEPVKVPSFVELKNLAIEYGIMAGPILHGRRHAQLNESERFDAFIHALLARYGHSNNS